MEPLSSFSGIASGFNFRDLVDAIIAAERRPADRARAGMTAAEKRRTALGGFRTVATTLQTAFSALQTGKGLQTLSTGVVGEAAGGRAILSATAGATAQRGSYQVEVLSLARAQKLGSNTHAETGTALGLAGDFTLNGASVLIDADDTLIEVRDKINAANTGASPSKVSASILTVGPNSHRLILTSDVAGQAGIARADGTGGVLASLGLLDPGAELVAGSDARFEIDGVPLQRATNTVTDAIAGLTLKLESAEVGTVVELKVERDAEGALTAAKAFVDAYNAAVGHIRSQSAATGPLRGDPTLRQSRAALSRAVLGVIGGEDGNPTTGASIGLSLSKTGELTLDETKFRAATAGEFDGLKALLTQGTGIADLKTTLDELLRANSGTLDTKVRALTESLTGLDARVGRIEARLESRRAALIRQFTQMESAIGQLQKQGEFLGSQFTALNRSR